MTTRQQLLREHEALEQSFLDLTTRATEGDWEDVDAVWDAFAAKLEKHLKFEEKDLFEAFAQRGTEQKAEVEKLREEHSEIRRTLAELGVHIQLHLVTAETIKAFVERLRDHAKHEDGAFYPWVEGRAGEWARRFD